MVSIVADLVGLEILHEPILSLPNFPTFFSTCSLDASVREQDSRNNIKIKVYVTKNSYLRGGGIVLEIHLCLTVHKAYKFKSIINNKKIKFEIN